MPCDPHTKQTTGRRGPWGMAVPQQALSALSWASAREGLGSGRADVVGVGVGNLASPWGPQSRKAEGSPAAEQCMQYWGDHGRAAADIRATACPGRGAGFYPTWVHTHRKIVGFGGLKSHITRGKADFSQLETPTCGKTDKSPSWGRGQTPACPA